MSNFIQKSLEELDHVVWPTENESKKYMAYTVGVIVIMATLLAILGYALRGILVGVRGQFDHTAVTTSTVSGEDLATKADLEKIKAELEKKKSVLSGSTIQVETSSGKSESGIVVTPNSSTGAKK